jgi:lipid-A-disaccharide synthase
VPEFLDGAGSPSVLAGAVIPLLSDSPERRRQLEGYARLDALMRLPEGDSPSERAARIVLDAMRAGPAPHRRRGAAQRRREIGT